MGRNYNQEIAMCIKNFLEKDEWQFDFEEDKGVFHFGLTLHNKIKSLEYHIVVREYDYTSYGVIPISADECKAEMAEFLTRTNYGLNNGNFELDYRDGEIRYKCFVNCDGVMPGEQIVKDSIYLPAMVVRHYADGILAVIFGMKTPEQAVKDCEEAE
ncbi:MAG TPA: YbjN domain-containing protein [Firmicutes bacterium]|nr:YbjN domain-containing protein [Bacillota bacterium]